MDFSFYDGGVALLCKGAALNGKKESLKLAHPENVKIFLKKLHLK